ncbi:pyrroline-5-carboxylate reductase [Pseudolabrys taiwanensis]|uniref:Pyrroline-5-carboxylate reductase n=1 Tax=Pseudolabrys taiwanensis TaxID=331696 RepID=A0A346A264_9HYPH|nr:pyrroline-5-carboxylate reductase [Pseudolabrys taiwanensis]AXK83261.1 pyrroline-5-carboxylate reductase [Pseudolabrys taiwanensis]
MARKPNTKPLAKFKGPLLLVGAGKMGQAMLDGWLARGLAPKKTAIIEPQPGKAIKALGKRGVTVNPKTGPKAKAAAAGAIVIAVKPQIAPDAVPPLGLHVGKGTLIVSIMAGRTLAFLEDKLPKGTAIVRAMPNTPAAIGRGITVAVANKNVSRAQRKLASDLLAAIGTVEWVDDERLMDAVTAVSGSGPAYVFLLAEAMAQAGVAAGLPATLAAKLARETVAGSGELLHRSPLDAATLRQNVTSPGGTTAAALEVLMGPGGFDALLTKAIAAATRRGRELAG